MSDDFGGFVATGLLAVALIGSTSLLMYEALRFAWRFMVRSTKRHGRILYALAAPFVVHVVGIWIYGAAYFVLIQFFPHLGSLISVTPAEHVDSISLLLCGYFSAATYTSLGFGDIVPVGHVRMIAGAEALNGLLLIGWSVTFSFLAMEEFWELPTRRGNDR
jgi:hypothetical protein